VALTSGTHLGPYEILAPLGVGGMGEVYRARDTRLDRTVAIKILPAHLSEDPILRQRFEREAKAISSLNHPHICVLHDVGNQDGTQFLVMECVEGETLAKRLEKGPLPLEQVLKYGTQIADALDKAHRCGVVHRDLKPGNIMLTASGAKLLDFGLAKAAPPLAAGATATAATTRTTPVTQHGTVVGTFQYMSPEQVEGKDVDARSDIFSFGSVLYEMVTGCRAFQGKSQLSVASAILEKDPEPISTLQPLTPPGLDRAIRVCVAKDPEDRWQMARDLLLELKWIAEAGSQAGIAAPFVARRKYRERIAWGIAAVGVLAAVFFAFAYFRGASTEVHSIRSSILPPEKATFEGVGGSGGPVAVSPDGRRLAFRARDASGKSFLWVRPLDGAAAQPLAGTEGPSFPFWSPDSRSIGFFADGKLKKIAASGGPAQTLCEASEGRGGTWNRDDLIVFSPTPGSPLYRVSASGGAATAVTQLDRSRRESTHRWPYFLPDGRHFLYFVRNALPGGPSEQNGLYVGSLDSKDQKLLLHADSNAIYAPPEYLLFWREQSLMAQPFDAKHLKLIGDAFPVAEQVQYTGGLNYGVFSVSENGILAYQAGGGEDRAQLLWFDANGKQIGSIISPGFHGAVRLSPDGQRLAEFVADTQGANIDIWVHELARGVRTRFTFDPSLDWYPVWSPDGSRIAFASNRKGQFNLYLKDSAGAGTEELLFESEAEKRPTDWSPDGRFIVFGLSDPKGSTRWDIWVLPLFGDRKPFPFLQTQFDEGGAVFSPDGRWLAYQSNESGRGEVYVAPFPGPGGKWQISNGGGRLPTWRHDGKGLFYLSTDNKLMAAEVTPKGSSVQVGVPRMLFQTNPTAGPTFARLYDVSPDGKRFLVSTTAEGASAPFTLVVNWTAVVKK